ncbi:histidine kinase [Oscillochloris trichoides DG-6]|uniref:histidine kinase n=1 Tax=Oscillochloris trichoides DG-6 TaxID=765420 RepID=E1IB35_9CHLR|nr:ATP-binding protein [Oscillochloris trichoides]EFO81606.1 histidine kinase [Oscillochloris trichoides DG-6]
MLAALVLILMVGGGGYLIVERYFQDVTDLALKHKMTHEFHSLAAPIPAELIASDRDWSLVRQEAAPLAPRPQRGIPLTQEQVANMMQDAYPQRQLTRIKLDEKRNRLIYEIYFVDQSEIYIDAYTGKILKPDEIEQPTTTITPIPEATAYDAELAAIFVLPLDAKGRVLFNPNQTSSPLTPHIEALQIALSQGSDLRTITTPDGHHVRLFTYKLTRDDGPVALQLGRVLTDQEHVLNQLLMVMLSLSGVSVVLLGVGSWWIAGRALGPAQQAWERQQSFIANASHELRTPLTLIRASTEVALRTAPSNDDDQRDLLEDVLSEADHMRRLVDDLLTLSRLDSGRLKLEQVPVDLVELLGDVQRQMNRVSQELAIQIRLGDVAGFVLADPDRLRQVLLILLDNALRHSAADTAITLSAQPHGHQVQIHVTDQGSGIAPEHLPHIFDRFYRADAARGVSGNAGLGLPIAKGLIEAQRGKLHVTSQLKVGTTVTITLQTARPLVQ